MGTLAPKFLQVGNGASHLAEAFVDLRYLSRTRCNVSRHDSKPWSMGSPEVVVDVVLVGMFSDRRAWTCLRVELFFSDSTRTRFAQILVEPALLMKDLKFYVGTAACWMA